MTCDLISIDICGCNLNDVFLWRLRLCIAMCETDNTSIDYKVLIFDPEKFSGKVINGERDGQRRCRFCGRILDEQHFTKEAHAISISLGNTKFICADECDECNEWFGRKLENDVTIFFQIPLSLYLVPKRNGKWRQITGRNFEMQMSNEPHPFSDIPILRFHARDWQDENISDVASLMKNFDLSNKTFVPQNVYKAICKYALSLMPHSLTLHYQKTIEWIQSDSFEHSLPKIKMASFDREGNEPIMALFLRKNDNKRFPLCIASLCVANIHLFYLLPFSDESESTEQDNILFDSFWLQFTKAAARIDSYKDCELSNMERTVLEFETEPTIEPGATPVWLKKDGETGQWIVDEES